MTTQKDIALTKLSEEIQKDIATAVELSKQCGVVELLYYLYYFHWIRQLNFFPNAQSENPHLIRAFSNALEDSYKYIISLISKYGSWKIRQPNKKYFPELNIKLVHLLSKHVNLINSKYENISMVQLFDVEVYGERNRYAKIDMSSADTNSDVKKMLDYYLRIDEDNNIKKISKKSTEDLIASFKEEYSPFDDLFEIELGINVEEFCWFISHLTTTVTEDIASRVETFEKYENGNVNVMSSLTFFNYVAGYVLKKDSIFDGIDKKFQKLIERLTFNAELFDENNLRYHYITRCPIIEYGEYVFISPELVLDSLFTNIHYSLIESETIKQKYMARKADLFLSKIASIASRYGYTEVKREYDLFEGKNKIGDIDIYFRNDANEYLLIEAKNHALPMDVYFKDISKTNEHLTYLKNEWEKKVVRRVNHLKSNHNSYGIPANYQYIVVSRFPEVISHNSDLFVVSIQEFEIWLEKHKSVTKFETFNSIVYGDIGTRFKKEDMDELKSANIIFGQFEEY